METNCSSEGISDFGSSLLALTLLLKAEFE